MQTQKYPDTLLGFATIRQREIMEAVNENGGNQRAAGRQLGINDSTVHQAVANCKKRAVVQGWSPEHDMTQMAPSPFVVRGTSTLYGDMGQKKLQWVKTRLDGELCEQVIRDFINGLATEIKGMAPKIAAPKHCNSDLLCVYPLGDPHFGMYAWAAEAGDDFDTAKAEALTCAAIDRLITSAPAAETAIILSLGDLIHADNNSNRTPQSGAQLDVDSRWQRVMQIALRATIHAAKRALEKHKKVIIRLNKGNHDPHASVAIALAIDAYFHGNERVTVDLTPSAHWYYQFGKVLVASTHGDTTKKKDLAGVMATDRPEQWGATKHRYWYCGHIHHVEVWETHGCVIEYFRTLASKDAWHSAAGYRSGRDMCCIVHHKEHGEIERHRCDIGMIDAVKGKKRVHK